jgi:hypothetical protein
MSDGKKWFSNWELEKLLEGWVCCHTAVISATLEADIGRSWFKASLETLFKKQTKTKRTGMRLK